jgi:3-(3-hydroxy-phenyl)propionate hydroxylase
MSKHSVAIAGGGPTGLTLAADLALNGVDVALFERRASQDLAGSRAGGLHSRGIELLDQRGVAERFLEAGYTVQVGALATITLEVSDFPTRHPYSLALWQNEIERILAEWVEELGVEIRYGQEVTGFSQDDDGVEVELADGGRVRAEYLVGCDGGRSLIRKAAGIEFPGHEPTTSNLIAEVELSEEPEWGIRNDTTGIHSLNRLEDDGPVRVMVTEREIGRGADPTLAELSAELTAVYGTDYGVHSPTWISRFTDMTRQAASYRAGRVLIAGDSAHIHYPAGGQGINNGMQDAANLGWKLAQVVKGTSPDDLLDTYTAERHPNTVRSLRMTMAQTALLRAGDERDEALREQVAEVVVLDEPRKRLAGLLSGLDTYYEMGDGDDEAHPLLGRRVPDLDLETADGTIRLYSLLHRARPALIYLGRKGGPPIDAWADRVEAVQATYEGEWELPVIGVVPSPSAVLVRPDGHVAWVGQGSNDGLGEALTRWFGPPAALEAELAAVRPEPQSA